MGLLQPTAAKDLVLYHGTMAASVDAIRSQGLHPPSSVMGGRYWYMLTTSFDQAAQYMGGRADAVVIEYHIPESKVWEHGRSDALLWPGDDNDVYGFHCVNYALKEPVPGAYIVSVHPLSAHTASEFQDVWRAGLTHAVEGLDLTDPDDRAILRGRVAAAFRNATLDAINEVARGFGRKSAPSRNQACRVVADALIAEHTAAGPSWRGLTTQPVWTWYEAVILTNQAGRTRSYEVYVGGMQRANRHSLEEAKAVVEQEYGPQVWERESMPLIEVEHYYWGKTTEFTDPLVIYYVNFIERTATGSTNVAGAKEGSESAKIRESRCQGRAEDTAPADRQPAAAARRLAHSTIASDTSQALRVGDATPIDNLKVHTIVDGHAACDRSLAALFLGDNGDVTCARCLKLMQHTASTMRVYRGMHFVLEGEEISQATLLARVQSDKRWGLGPHWSTDRSVALGFARPQKPEFYPKPITKPNGEVWVDTYYTGPKGMSVSVLLEGDVATDAHSEPWSNIGVMVPTESEVTLAPGTPVMLVALSWFDGSTWQRIPLSMSVTASAGRVVRGFPVEVPTYELALKMQAGTITARELLDLVDDEVGVWWGPLDSSWPITEAQEYAGMGGAFEELVSKWLPEYDEGDPLGMVEIVLVAEHPIINGELWDEWNEHGTREGDALEVPEGTSLRLVEVRYDAGWGWKVLSAQGITVTASTQRLYHGTWHDLPVGMVLRSGVEPGNYNNAGSVAASVVWMTDDVDDARSWAMQALRERGIEGAARVYEVEPIGEVREWDPPDHLVRLGIHHYTASEARIVGTSHIAASTWQRRPYGYLSADGEVFLERGAVMSGVGTNAFQVWFRCKEGEYERDAAGFYGPSSTNPIRSLSEVTGAAEDGDEPYVHLYDSGSLAEGKDTAEYGRIQRRGVAA